jgi:hypothetical protein
MKLFSFSLASMAILFAFPALSQTLQIIPASPKGGETIRVRTSSSHVHMPENVRRTMVDNKITVTAPVMTIVPLLPGNALNAPVEVVLGQLPAGEYEVEVKLENAPQVTFTTARFTVTDENIGRTRPFPRFDFTDLWWYGGESGWGISIHVKNDALFAAWFAYDEAGRAAWYTVQGGGWSSPFTYAGRVIKTTGTPWGGVLPLISISAREVGTALIDFRSFNEATMTYTVEGISSQKSLTRQPF